jgi:hypothetical protein
VSDEKISGMGNSKNRRKVKRLTDAVIAQAKERLPKPESSPIRELPDIFERIFRAVENPFVQTPISVLGGIVGFFAYGPLVMICSISVFAGVHRSKALDGIQKRYQGIAWILIIAGVLAGFYGIGRQIEKHRDHIPTAKEIAEQVWSGIRLTSNSITNNTYQTVSSQPKRAKMIFGFQDETGAINSTLTTQEPPLVLGPARFIGPNIPALPIPSKIVKVDLMGRVIGNKAAKNVHVFTKICGGCDYVSVPDGFLRPTVWPNSKTDTDRVLGDIVAGPELLVGDFQIAMPFKGDSAEFDVAYTCDNCPPLRENTSKLTIKLISKQP